MSDLPASFRTPRFMSNDQLREHFGLSERALNRLLAMPDFPRKDMVTNKTDSRAVDAFFDRFAGLTPHARGSNDAARANLRLK